MRHMERKQSGGCDGGVAAVVVLVVVTVAVVFAVVVVVVGCDGGGRGDTWVLLLSYPIFTRAPSKVVRRRDILDMTMINVLPSCFFTFFSLRILFHYCLGASDIEEQPSRR